MLSWAALEASPSHPLTYVPRSTRRSQRREGLFRHPRPRRCRTIGPPKSGRFVWDPCANHIYFIRYGRITGGKKRPPRPTSLPTDDTKKSTRSPPGARVNMCLKEIPRVTTNFRSKRKGDARTNQSKSRARDNKLGMKHCNLRQKLAPSLLFSPSLPPSLTPVDVTTTILPMSEGPTPTSLKALLATSVASGSAHSANRWNLRAVLTRKLEIKTHDERERSTCIWAHKTARKEQQAVGFREPRGRETGPGRQALGTGRSGRDERGRRQSASAVRVLE